jgi:aspartate ammonia-lyase
MEVVQELQGLTGLPVTRAENLEDNTANFDAYVEIHGILKAHAVNLEKIAGDVRLLSSDLLNEKDMEIPKRQTGSSIMPGKVNPVISEYVISIAHKVYANDGLITSLSAQGILDLNAYLPVIGYALIESLELLIAANKSFRQGVFSDLKINEGKAKEKLYRSFAIVTALLPYIGYNKSALLANEMKLKNIDVFAANKNLKLVDTGRIKKLLSVEHLLKTGFRLEDLM